MSADQRAGRPLAVVAGALAAAGAVVLVLGFTRDEGPPQPPVTDVVTVEPQRTASPETSAVPTPIATPAVPLEAGGVPESAPGSEPVPATDPTSEPQPAAVAAPAVPSGEFGPVLPASAPSAVHIPAIGLDPTALVPLSIGEDGVLAAPVDYADPGWHVAGPTPGQLGPAVIAGHVDGPGGPAVFYRLGELQPGDQVDVAREDGSIATFTVDSVERYAKAAFPTSRVYGNTTNRAELRLITCGGAFDRTTGHYVDNIVVFAHLTAQRA